MIERTPGVDRSRDAKDHVQWKNTDTVEVPAFGVVQIASRATTPIRHYTTVQPDGDGTLFLANGPVPVAVDGYSTSKLWTRPRQVLLETGSEVGDEVGPVADSFEMTSEGSGYIVWREPLAGVGVVLESGGSGKGTHIVDFTVEDVFCPDDEDNEHGVLYVDATVDYSSQGCTIAIPGADNYGFIQVFDKCSIMSVLTEDELLDKEGRAIYMYPRDGYCNAKWYVLDICHTQECE